jgi:putative oxidoreductase
VTDTSPSRSSDIGLLIARLAMAPLFLISVYYKVTQWPGIVTVLDGQGLPLPMLGGAIAIAIEAILPLLLILGLRMRWAALGLIVYVLGTNLIAHRFWEFTGGAQLGQMLVFFKNIALCGGLLVLTMIGPGRFAMQPRP